MLRRYLRLSRPDAVRQTASGTKIVTFRSKCSHAHACKSTLCATGFVSLEIYAPVMRAALLTGLLDIEEVILLYALS